MRIGVDIGGTKIVAGIVDGSGRVLERQRIPTDPAGGYDDVLRRICSLIGGLIDLAGGPSAVDLIGIASAGQIRMGSGIIAFSPNLGWHNVPIRQDIESRFNIRTVIENDVNAATYGEWRCTLSGKPDVALGIFVGTGIGGGIIIDGRLFTGFSHVGAEIGHMVVNPYGYRCSCGNTGCFEAYCGGAYFTARVAAEIRRGHRGKIWECIGGDLANINARSIEEAAMMDDPVCRRIWGEVVEYLGAGIAGLCNILNPGVVILGGGVIYGTDSLVDDARKVAERRMMPASLEGVAWVTAKLGEDAALTGAVLWDCAGDDSSRSGLRRLCDGEGNDND